MKLPLAALALALAALASTAASAQNPPALAPALPPRITYSKSFRGSVPSFVEITVQRDGAASFEVIQQPGQPPDKMEFHAAKALVDRIFALAAQLHDFSGPELEAKTKVGYMGTKMLAYDDATRHNQQTYNYSSHPAARDLTDIFERIAGSGEHAARLRHAVRYDRLGVVQELDGITRDWSEHQLLAPELLKPVLERVANDPDLMDIAHRRALDLLTEMGAARNR